MDPITIFAAATAAFNGIKKAIEIGKEVEEVYQQLSTWAGHVSDLHKAIHEQENRKPGLWEKIGFEKSETAEAFDTYIAKQKLIEWEKEIYHEFHYGSLCHLGRTGYEEFRAIRRQIREKREKMILDQMRARKEFIDSAIHWLLVTGLILFGVALIWGTVDVILTYAPK